MSQNKKSLGSLRAVHQATEKHPRLLGKIKIQRHTFQIIAMQFVDYQLDEVEANLAGWINRDFNGQYLTLELSPKFVSKQRDIVEQPDPFVRAASTERRTGSNAALA